MTVRRSFLSILLCFLVALAGCRRAAPVSTPPGEPPILGAAREIMAAAGFCALITIGEDGHPQARVMDPAAPDARMAVTLMTNPASRKVAQIARDPRVTLFYFDPESLGYVTIVGRAERVVDPEEKRRRWLDRWSPHIARPEDALLYEVVPQRIEVVSVARGVTGDEGTWTPPSIDLR
ncbi:MAG: pyridoxamine 5'-phosphate oxidase family protein [Acidobacteria bacterium]|nr:pyridoxamine 5'-phosphate oxidase family protein [Acidobacteriota bacterium]